MQEDFHYYATYCAAMLAGYSHKESLDICYSAQFVDLCSRTLLSKLKAPVTAATTQLQLELMDASTDPVSLQNITRIWAAFHFLPRDLYADAGRGTRQYKNKYRLLCGPNGALVKDTVELAKGGTLQAVGIAMHVLADTWAHQHFAGTPSLVMNNTTRYFYELIPKGERYEERLVRFNHNPSSQDDLEESVYTNCVYQYGEHSIMNLGHGRAGHLPDYSCVRYKYMPAWADYEEIIKDNPADYERAFCQMVYAMRCIRGDEETFQTDVYDETVTVPYRTEIRRILEKRQLIASEDWKALGERISGEPIEDFDLEKYREDYIRAEAEAKDETFIGQFVATALAHKSMVTHRIFSSGNMLAGFSVDLKKQGFRGLTALMKQRKASAAGETKEKAE